MAGELESCKPLSGLLNGLAQDAFHGHPGITEELLRSQLYPEVQPEEFRPFLAKMRGILKEGKRLLQGADSWARTFVAEGNHLELGPTVLADAKHVCARTRIALCPHR